MSSPGEVWMSEAEIIEVDEGQGGHAGNGVSSIEEIHRPGKNYIVTHSGVTYHGKSFAPEETPRGGAHVTVLHDGKIRINAGTMDEIKHRHLKNALKR